MSAPDLPGLPRDAAGAPVFPEPWQARAFALAVHLNARGRLRLAGLRRGAGAELAREDDYWHAWLRALEGGALAARTVSGGSRTRSRPSRPRGERGGGRDAARAGRSGSALAGGGRRCRRSIRRAMPAMPATSS